MRSTKIKYLTDREDEDTKPTFKRRYVLQIKPTFYYGCLIVNPFVVSWGMFRY